MTDSNNIRRTNECARCENNARSSFLVCAVNPCGVPEGIDTCPDFALDPSIKTNEQWEPEGASYCGELITTPLQRWTAQQRLDLLNWHPLFTGRCPNCERAIAQTHPPRIHWDCEFCGWRDDSV